MGQFQLNKAQEEVVAHDQGPLLVLAGAGSGKTGVVTRRIARMIESGVPAESIIAMTFTNKAASEMHERVTRLVGPKACKQLLACTFHHFGLHVLRREAKAMGLRGGKFAIYDRSDCTSVLRAAMRAMRTEQGADLGAVLNRISLAKNAFLDPEDYETQHADSDDEYDQITIQAYPRFQRAMDNLQAFDFDDLVCQPVHLWRKQPDVLQRWQRRFRYVIVDEYQDTNLVQLEMLRLLVKEHKNLCVVGDDDQAIYAWRGADVRNILDFAKHFRGAKIVKLEHNYRSTAAVLNLANAVLANSSSRRHPKQLICTQGEGDVVELVRAPDGDAEALFVARKIQILIDNGDARPRDIAILYRSNKQAPEIEATLKMEGIPYELTGSKQLFEKKEVKDLLAYLRVAIEPFDELAVRRTLNYPARGIGDVALGKIVQHATAKEQSLYAAICKAHEIQNLSGQARNSCRTYVRHLAMMRQGIEAKKPSKTIMNELIEALDLKSNIAAECGSNNKLAARRWGNVQYLLRSFGRHDERGGCELKEFLQRLLLRDDDRDKNKEQHNRVTMTTMHGAKGLEFSYVFLVGLEDGLMPHKRVLDERVTDAAPLSAIKTDEIEQERRLLYVAITRAKKKLFLCHATTRLMRGAVLKRATSRFLQKLPEELFTVQDLEIVEPIAATHTKSGADAVLAALLGN